MPGAHSPERRLPVLGLHWHRMTGGSGLASWEGNSHFCGCNVQEHYKDFFCGEPVTDRGPRDHTLTQRGSALHLSVLGLSQFKRKAKWKVMRGPFHHTAFACKCTWNTHSCVHQWESRVDVILGLAWASLSVRVSQMRFGLSVLLELITRGLCHLVFQLVSYSYLALKNIYMKRKNVRYQAWKSSFPEDMQCSWVSSLVWLRSPDYGSR